MESYYCIKCLESYSDLEPHKITINGKKVFRCSSCFESGNVIYGLEKECKICFDKDTSIIFSQCGHTICDNCRTHTDRFTCPFCNKSDIWNYMTSIDAIHVRHDNYFSTVVPELRSLFKEFYYQIVHTKLSDQKFYFTLYEQCAEYCKFLKLLHLNNNNHNPNKLGVPSKINEIWLLHLEHKESYKLVCEIICGYELDYIYTKTKDDFNLTKELYLQTYELNQCATEFAIWCELDFPASQIFVKTLMGETVTVPINVNESAKKFKFLIYRIAGIDPYEMRLIWCGRQLNNNSLALKDYNIEDCATLHLVLKLRGD